MTSSRSTPTTPASGAHAHDAHGENLSEATLIHTPANQLHLGCHVLALFSVLCTTLSGTWKSRKVIQVESVNASGDGTGRHVNTALPHIGYRIMASLQSASKPHNSCPVTPVTLRRHPFLRQQRHRKQKVEKRTIREKGSHDGLGKGSREIKGTCLQTFRNESVTEGLTRTLALLHVLAKPTPTGLRHSGETPYRSETARLNLLFSTTTDPSSPPPGQPQVISACP